MTETAPLAAAHQAIGAYYCQFSRVEHELGESVKVVYGLENNEASDAVVAGELSLGGEQGCQGHRGQRSLRGMESQGRGHN